MARKNALFTDPHLLKQEHTTLFAYAIFILGKLDSVIRQLFHPAGQVLSVEIGAVCYPGNSRIFFLFRKCTKCGIDGRFQNRTTAESRLASHLPARANSYEGSFGAVPFYCDEHAGQPVCPQGDTPHSRPHGVVTVSGKSIPAPNFPFTSHNAAFKNSKKI